MASEAPLAKQLRIKFSVVSRIQKELAAYQVELSKQTAKIATMRAAAAEEHDIRQQVSADRGELAGPMAPGGLRPLAACRRGRGAANRHRPRRDCHRRPAD